MLPTSAETLQKPATTPLNITHQVYSGHLMQRENSWPSSGEPPNTVPAPTACF